ncbi:hypothetical protein QBC38DRAFT_460955 [Podospora fimiseda]|uniref:Secreted protein n=1 Tax=Podospora fimiseda TaxID=252190 RepID=A0AAN6YMC9_9PEZI|nr:hypothetical protein QBC38DRAFT_460955 [Podospora fimiseda]
MKSTSILSTIAVFLAGANGLATPVMSRRSGEVGSPIPEGFTVAELEWEVETTPGGSNVTLTGTVEQVHAKLLEINPNWDEEFAPIIAKRNAEAMAAEGITPKADGVLSKRDWTVCGDSGYGHDGAHTGAIETGVAYLRGLSGQASRGPGPRSCVQVSCSWSSAIWYCNNNSYTKYMPWVHIANAGQVLLDSCKYYTWPNWWVSGERHHDDGWFAIVAWNPDCNKYS